MAEQTIKLSVARYDPDQDGAPRMQEYEVPYAEDQVVLDSLHGAGKEQMRDLVAESKRALDSVLSRLDSERQTLAERADRKVEAAQLALLKELGEFLGDRINNPLAVIMASAQLLEMRAPGSATTEAAERITAAVSKINAVVREIAEKSGERVV